MTRLLLVLALLTGCQQQVSGIADQPCYGNGTCNDGLRCDDGTCRRPPPGDCAPVAERLASFELGNYAPAEARAPKVAEMAALCAQAGLSVDDAACLVAATSEAEAADCAKPLLPRLVAMRGPGGCEGVTARLREEMAKAQLPAMLTGVAMSLVAAVGSSCENEPWPPAARACASQLDMRRSSDFEACLTKLPKPMRERLETTIKALMAGVPGGMPELEIAQ